MISIIVPAHNVEQYLPACLDSILAQTFSSYEVLIVDDGSTDATGTIARWYREHWSRDHRRSCVFRHISRTWAGTAAARNHGMDIARGEYLMFLDADDTLHPSALEVLFAAAHRYDATTIIAEYERTDRRPTRRTFGRARASDYYVPMGADRALREFGLGRIRRAVWGSLWHRGSLASVRFAGGRFHEDAEFMPRALLASERTVCIPDCVYRYRIRPGSFMTTVSERRLDVFWAHACIHDVLTTRYRSPRIHAYARASLVSAAASLVRMVALDDTDNDGHRDNSMSGRRRRRCSRSWRKRWRKRWRARIFSRVSRRYIALCGLDPLLPLNVRIHGLLALTGFTGYARGVKTLRALVKLVRGVYRD